MDKIEDLRTALVSLSSAVAIERNRAKRVPSIPTLLGIQYDENAISDYIAALLDPNKISLGFDILNALLERFGRQSVSSIGLVVVRREYWLSSRSRIDIWIEYDKIPILAIENKILSFEGDKQTNRYSEDVSKLCVGAEPLMIFLTPGGWSPQSNNFVILSYRNFADCIESCLQLSRGDLDELFFARNFLKYVEEAFSVNTKIELSDSTKEYIIYREVVESVRQKYDQESSQLMQHFWSIVEAVFHEDEWIQNCKWDRPWQQLLKTPWNNKKSNIHFEVWLDKDLLLSENEFSVMIDVERDPTRKVMNLILEKLGESEKERLESKGYVLSPPKRPEAIVFRTFSFRQKIYELTDQEIEEMFSQIRAELAAVFNCIDSALRSLT